jgi:hypothetical protein
MCQNNRPRISHDKANSSAAPNFAATAALAQSPGRHYLLGRARGAAAAAVFGAPIRADSAGADGRGDQGSIPEARTAADYNASARSVSDRIALIDAIEDAGIERAKAERIATVIIDTVRNNVATKADVQDLHEDLSTARIELKADTVALRTELKSDVAASRTERKADFALMRGDLDNLEARLRSEIVRAANRTLIFLGGVMTLLLVSVVIVIFVLLRHRAGILD